MVFERHNTSVARGALAVLLLAGCGGPLGEEGPQAIEVSTGAMTIPTDHPVLSIFRGLGAVGSGTDVFAVSRSRRQNPSNLNNAPHITLAIASILSREGEGQFKKMMPAQLAGGLRGEYRIKSRVTRVRSAEGNGQMIALKFENGAVFADGAGDGSLELGDYNFTGALADIQQKYGIAPADLDAAMNDSAFSSRFEELVNSAKKTIRDAWPAGR